MEKNDQCCGIANARIRELEAQLQDADQTHAGVVAGYLRRIWDATVRAEVAEEKLARLREKAKEADNSELNGWQRLGILEEMHSLLAEPQRKK